MRYLFLFLLLLLSQFVTGQNTMQSEEFEYEYKNVLRLSPIELGRAEFQVGYERYFANRDQSIGLFPSLIKSSRGEESRDGFQMMLQYRFYLSQLQRKANETLNMFNIGFYAAPYLIGLTSKETSERYSYNPETFGDEYYFVEETINALEGGALLGIQLDITRRIVLDFYVGGGIRESKVTSTDNIQGGDFGIFEAGYAGVKPRIGLQMGITF